MLRRHLPLVAALLAAGSRPEPLGSCAQVHVVHTNMAPSAAAGVLEVYEQVAASVVPAAGVEPDLNTTAIGDTLTARHGGFWDVFLLGNSFSYSIYCIDYVELAGEYWTVLICKESVDEWGNDCGQDGLSLYVNGTLAPKALASMSQGTFGASTPEGFSPKLEFYQHYQLGESVKAAHTNTLAGIISTFQPSAVNSSLADWMRRRVEAAWPADYWNVVIEVSPGAS